MHGFDQGVVVRCEHVSREVYVEGVGDGEGLMVYGVYGWFWESHAKRGSFLSYVLQPDVVASISGSFGRSCTRDVQDRRPGVRINGYSGPSVTGSGPKPHNTPLGGLFG